MIFGITNLVQTLHRRPLFPLMPIGVLTLLLAGCGLFSSRYGNTPAYYHPLTVQLRPAPSVTAASIKYQDACGQTQSLSIAKPLMEALTRKSGRVFEKIVKEGTGVPVDGYEDVAVVTNVDLAIPRKVKKSYPATVTIGLDFSYTAADGEVLYGKKLQSIGRGEVDVSDDSCDVKGLEKLAEEAIGYVTDGMAKYLGTSNRVVAAAEARKFGQAPPPPANVVPPPVPSVGGPIAAVESGTSGLSGAPPSVARADEPAHLIFRAIIRDENRNQLVHGGETISVEIEVKNEGPGEALGVEVLVAGTPELVEQIPGVVPVGDIPLGEVRRVVVEGKIGKVKEAAPAELLLNLRAKSTTTQVPSAKRFTVSMKPGDSPEAVAQPVDVDDIPKRMGKLKQPKAIGLAVGIGRFREAALSRSKYAARDAETMATYWQMLAGVPPERIRRLIDERALKSDMAETLEEWLPKQADPTTVVYVYISGRGAVDATTGAVSIVPFDGVLSSGARLYSLRRLCEALSKLPIQRAIVMLDLSLEAVGVKEGTPVAVPQWELEGQAKDKVMLMIGNRLVQEAHAYDLGQHGLFTYGLLKGWGGYADVDKDGTILAGELCTYAKGQVGLMAREQFGNEQEPVCIPGPGQGATVRLHTMAKVK